MALKEIIYKFSNVLHSPSRSDDVGPGANDIGF